MNVADSALMGSVLREAGFQVTPEMNEASLVLVNTCAVRDRAEERVVQRLRELVRLKRRRPDLVIGITGCVPKHLGEALLRDVPGLDLMVGPDSYRRLPELVEEAAVRPAVDLRLDTREDYSGLDPVSVEGVHAFVPIMRGCDRFCTFCVVPLTRGREKSLPLEEVLRQVRSAVDRGIAAVTLLGQTVNSYRHGEDDFTTLLEKVSEIVGLRQIRFTSPHPADFQEAHFRLMRERPQLAPHLHLPVQSGSDRILESMKRGYTRGEFLRVVETARRHLPEVGLTTDLIVGYPGETEEDYEATLSLLREVAFDSAFFFRYSERSGTWASRHLPDDVPSEVKADRLSRLIALQEAISLQRHRRFVGREIEVLVEGPSRRHPQNAAGRAGDFKRVILPGGPPSGTMARVLVAGASSHSLVAEGVSPAVALDEEPVS